MGRLPQLPSLEQLRNQAEARQRDHGIALSVAQYELARLYGFGSWPKLVQHVQAATLNGVERALVVADVCDAHCALDRRSRRGDERR